MAHQNGTAAKEYKKCQKRKLLHFRNIIVLLIYVCCAYKTAGESKLVQINKATKETGDSITMVNRKITMTACHDRKIPVQILMASPSIELVQSVIVQSNKMNSLTMCHSQGTPISLPTLPWLLHSPNETSMSVPFFASFWIIDFIFTQTSAAINSNIWFIKTGCIHRYPSSKPKRYHILHSEAS